MKQERVELYDFSVDESKELAEKNKVNKHPTFKPHWHALNAGVVWHRQLSRYKQGMKYNVISRIHGCYGGCPHKGTIRCPYGVGMKKFDDDIRDGADVLVRSKGTMVDAYVREDGEVTALCPERISELKMFVNSANTMSGLRVLRTENLMKLKEEIEVLERSLAESDALLDERGVTDKDGLKIPRKKGMISVVNDKGEIVDIDLVKAREKLFGLRSKYHEKLDTAIMSEAKIQEVEQSKITADDINAQLKRVKGMIDVTPESASSSKRLIVDTTTKSVLDSDNIAESEADRRVQKSIVSDDYFETTDENNNEDI